LGLIDVRKVPATGERLDRLIQQRLQRLFLRGAQNAILRSPDHMQ
jgi:hypothetical protein